MGKSRGKRKNRVGRVIKNKMDKTVVVSVERMVQHPLYGKYIKRHIKYVAHDEKMACNVGDKVVITETRPLSRTKRWRVSEVLEKIQ
jgi:small subunit ribosomal protein S17